MTFHHVLGKLGVYLEPDFLSPAECAELRAAVDAGQRHQARIFSRRQQQELVDESHRRTSQVRVDGGVAQRVAARFEAARPRIAEHFGFELSSAQDPHFLVYETGDFFNVHRDTEAEDEEEEPDYMTRRRVTAVLFLSSEGVESDPGEAAGYEGGSLVLYDLMASAPDQGLPVQGREGLLVAFAARQRHAVTEVAAGRRYTALTWYV